MDEIVSKNRGKIGTTWVGFFWIERIFGNKKQLTSGESAFDLFELSKNY